MFDSSTVCPTVGRSVYTTRSSDRPVGQTSRTDRSVRRSERVNSHLGGGYNQWCTGGRGGSFPGRSRRGGAKQPCQKYFNDHKSEFDKVCWMRQQQPIATNYYRFCCHCWIPSSPPVV